VIDFKTGKNKKDHLLRNKLNSVIKGKSVKYPESFVAEPVDLIICEDAGSYPESFFDIHIRPRVLDTGGRIFLNSVPPITKTNWLVHLSRNDTVDSFSWSLYDNVYLKKEEIENFIRDCPPHLHRAFVDGLPPEEDSSVFGKIRDNVMGGFFEYTPGHVYQGGVDIGSTFDRTDLSISDLTLGRLAYIDVFPPKFSRTELLEERLLNSLKRYEFPNTYVDVSGIGSAFQAMIDSHHFFLPFTIPNLKTRNALIEELAIAFQRNYTIPEIPYLINELENLEIILKQNYHLYRSRHGFHDDTIIATALSIYGWSRKMNPVDFRSIEPVEIKATVIEDNRFQITPIDPVSLVGEEYLL